MIKFLDMCLYRDLDLILAKVKSPLFIHMTKPDGGYVSLAGLSRKIDFSL